MSHLPSNPTPSFVARNPHLYGVNPTVNEVSDIHKQIRAVQLKRIKQDSKPLMNKLEAEFKSYEEARTGHVLIPQSIRFKLGNGIWYKPDFIIFDRTFGLKAIEVKGPFAHRGGFENLKVAASLYQLVAWWLVWKDDGQWNRQLILP